MSLLRDQSRRGSTWSYLLLVGLLVVLYLLRAPIGYVIEPIFAGAYLPLWQAHNVGPVMLERVYLAGTKTKQELITDNIRLTNELNTKSTLKATINTLKLQNESMQKALGRGAVDGRKLAFVLSSLTSSPHDTLNIDLGEQSEIAKGDVVYSADNVILGEVVEVYQQRSKVRLFSSYGTDSEVMLDDVTRVIARGEGSQNFFLSLPQGLAVSMGSVLYWPGQSGSVLATVERLTNDPGEAFVRVYARSPVNINALTEVYVDHE